MAGWFRARLPSRPESRDRVNPPRLGNPNLRGGTGSMAPGRGTPGMAGGSARRGVTCETRAWGGSVQSDRAGLLDPTTPPHRTHDDDRGLP